MKRKIGLGDKNHKSVHWQRGGAILLLAMSGATLSANAQDKVVLSNSIVSRIGNDSAVRLAASNELDEEIAFSVSMKMRDFEEFESRVEKGEIIPEAEKIAKYYPLASDVQRVRDWLLAEGLLEQSTEGPQLSVFVHAKASQVAQSLQVRFAKKQEKKSAYLSAIDAPSVPADIAKLILGVNGLQPEDRSRSFDETKSDAIQGPAVYPSQSFVTTTPPFSPMRVYNAYNGSSLPATGANQAIAIIGTYLPLQQDLEKFWSQLTIAGGPSQTYSNIFPIIVAGTTGAADTSGYESTLDVEWASTIAPSSQIRFYYCKNYASDNLTRAYQRIITDLSSGAYPNIHQVSLSFGARETDISPAQATSWMNQMATIASYGVTIFAGSGDGGSNPNALRQPGYPSNPLCVSIPASIPTVTGVGGTTLHLDGNTGLSTGETAWSGSGGGASVRYSQPSYQQNVPNVPNDSKRHVPDVAMVGDPNTGGYVCYTDLTQSNPQQLFYQYGGTSLSTPIMAGICARVNQARSDFGLGALGNSFNQRTYGLIQTSAYRDITSGSNGAYSAGPGYNQVTGCGVPRIPSLFHSTSVPFFTREVDLGGGVYWLGLANGGFFGYYNYTYFPIMYHYDFGFINVSNQTDSQSGLYFYDYASGDQFYTSPSFAFPYLSDFTLNAILYYYPATNNPGHYTTNPRYFHNFSTGNDITR